MSLRSSSAHENELKSKPTDDKTKKNGQNKTTEDELKNKLAAALAEKKKLATESEKEIENLKNAVKKHNETQTEHVKTINKLKGELREAQEVKNKKTEYETTIQSLNEAANESKIQKEKLEHMIIRLFQANSNVRHPGCKWKPDT